MKLLGSAPQGSPGSDPHIGNWFSHLSHTESCTTQQGTEALATVCIMPDTARYGIDRGL